jgi:uncharacterized membrane protein YphA (DoxX/SURF4 family)
MTNTVAQVLQVIVALGLLNVWLIRANKRTSYRGGNAQTLREEFAAYGLPGWFCSVVGFLKIFSAIMLLLGLWLYPIVLPAALLIAILMVGAVAMHIKVHDSIVKVLPALSMLLMSVLIFAHYYNAVIP